MNKPFNTCKASPPATTARDKLKRVPQKKDSIGPLSRQLFYLCCDEMEDIRFIESLLLLIELLCETLTNELLITEEQIQQFLDTFFEKNDANLSGCLVFDAL